jgi:hypothetical protein
MGMGVGQEEMGYMYGQYKRISLRIGGQNLFNSAFEQVGHEWAFLLGRLVSLNGNYIMYLI